MLDHLPDELILRILAEVPFSSPVDGFDYHRLNAFVLEDAGRWSTRFRFLVQAALLWPSVHVDTVERVAHVLRQDAHIRSFTRDLVVNNKGIDYLDVFLRVLPELQAIRVKHFMTERMLPRTVRLGNVSVATNLRTLTLRNVHLSLDGLCPLPSLEGLSLADLVFDKEAARALLTPAILPNLRVFHFADILSGYTPGSSSYFPRLSTAFCTGLDVVQAPPNLLDEVVHARKDSKAGAAPIMVHLAPMDHMIKLRKCLPAHLELFSIPLVASDGLGYASRRHAIPTSSKWTVKLLVRVHSALEQAAQNGDRRRMLESISLPGALHPTERHYPAVEEARNALLQLCAHAGVAVRWVDDARVEGDEHPAMARGFGEWWRGARERRGRMGETRTA
ncbi:hypothetical protein JCM3770_000584 [Rhodotorula araucariae]